MRLSSQQVEPEQLVALANEAGRLLITGEFSKLAAQFGYAVALGRDPATAIKEDLHACLAKSGQRSLLSTVQPDVQIKYLKSNDQLLAVAECRLAIAGGCQLLAELVISVAGNDIHATLEQISTAA